MAKRRKLNAKNAQKPQKPNGGNKPPHAKQQQQQHQQKPQQRQQGPKAGKQQHHQKQHEEPTIPFNPNDRILLIGEGDLSFAASLVKHHGCRNVTATVLEKSEEELLEKYPHAKANIDIINGSTQVRDKETEQGGSGEGDGEDSEGQQDEDSESEGDDDDDQADDLSDEDEAKPKKTSRKPANNRIVYSIDATKPLPPSLTRPPHGPPNRILFNFPHVGGKSTDVNRQVRFNQSLLVSFFSSCTASTRTLSPRGTIIVTLFEAEPYTLWNVRDLARHAGLQVERSFRFQAGAYPGYRHARTLGVVRDKNGEESGWRGEDRGARSYVFVRKGETSTLEEDKAKGKKKRRREEDEEEDSDDGED